MTYQEVNFNLDTKFPSNLGNPFSLISEHNKTAMKQIKEDKSSHNKKINELTSENRKLKKELKEDSQNEELLKIQ